MIPSRHHLPIHEVVVLFDTDLVKVHHPLIYVLLAATAFTLLLG